MASHVLSSLGLLSGPTTSGQQLFLDLVRFTPSWMPCSDSALYFPGTEPSLGRAAGEQKMHHSARVCVKQASCAETLCRAVPRPLHSQTLTANSLGASWDQFREHTCTQDFSSSPQDTPPLLQPSSSLSRLLFYLYLSKVLRGGPSEGGLPQLKLPLVPGEMAPRRSPLQRPPLSSRSRTSVSDTPQAPPTQPVHTDSASSLTACLSFPNPSLPGPSLLPKPFQSLPSLSHCTGAGPHFLLPIWVSSLHLPPFRTLLSRNRALRIPRPQLKIRCNPLRAHRITRFGRAAGSSPPSLDHLVRGAVTPYCTAPQTGLALSQSGPVTRGVGMF